MAKSWSASLEHGEYETDRELVIRDGLEAVEKTAAGKHVNLVTPGVFGNPAEYLTPALKKVFGEAVSCKYIDQCGCGGHVLRVYK
nr:CGCGG family rSAM-modified RiPP protein [Evansella caseinilytica]